MHPFDMPIDRHHIDINDARQLRWWCGKLGCGDIKLKAAVRRVGHSPHEVDRYLRAARVSGQYFRR